MSRPSDVPALQTVVPLVLALLVGCGPASGPEDPVRPGGAAAGTSGWTRLPDGPLGGRVGAVVVGVGRHALVVGGWEWLCPPTADCVLPDLPLLADAALLDLDTGEWRPAADAPYGLRHAAATSLDGDAYLLTGCRRAPTCDGAPELLRYDAGADRWDRLAALPDRDWSGQLLPVGEGLVAVAATEERGEESDYAYDPRTDTWEALPDDPLDRPYDRYAVLDGDRLLLLGSSERRNRKEVAALDLASGTWSRLPDAPGLGYQAWRAGDEIWLNPHFGAGGGGVLDLATDTWRLLPELPADGEQPWDLAGVVGEDGASYDKAEGWVRDTRTGRWVEIPSRGGHAYDEALAAVGQALVVFGGQDWGDPTAVQQDGRLVDHAWVWRPPA